MLTVSFHVDAANIDFIPQSMELTFLPDERTMEISVDIVNDDLSEESEQFTARLTEVPAGSEVCVSASRSISNITIEDNDSK